MKQAGATYEDTVTVERDAILSTALDTEYCAREARERTSIRVCPDPSRLLVPTLLEEDRMSEQIRGVL